MLDAEQINAVPVVGVGASAGGLETLTQMLQALPADTGIAFVFVQHLHPEHESMMAELLSRHTQMPVIEVEDALRIQPDHVYMIPPNKYLRLVGNDLFLDEPVKDRGMRMSINHFFRSLAQARGSAAVAVVLSGTGTDGTLGLREIKASGGVVIVQQPSSALYGGMPRSAVSTGIVDFVSPVEKIPEILTRIKNSPPFLKNKTPFELAAPDEFEAILRLLRAHTDYDFGGYKTGTLGRRVERRMSLLSIKTAGAYVRMLRQKPDEVQALFKDLLISVTSFFREKEAWDLLKDQVMAPLIAAKQPPESSIRLWVAGCATGEEAYSLVMLILEQLDEQKKSVDVQAFATDLDTEAIAVGRGGRYPSAANADVEPERLRRFFHEEGETVRANKLLRESIVFAVHNLISDPPFSNLDLISCRNLLIYLEQDVQASILEIFFYALRDGGYLFLGNSESVSSRSELFEPVSKRWRIFRKSESSSPRAVQLPKLSARTLEPPRSRLQLTAPSVGTWKSLGTAELGKRILLEELVEAAVLVDQRGKVLYQHGSLRDFLDFQEGPPAHDIASMALPGLGSQLRHLLKRAFAEGEPAVEKLQVRRGKERLGVGVTVRPVIDHRHTLEDEPQTLAAVRFEEISADFDRDRPSPDGAVEDRGLVQQLESELQATRADLGAAIADLETLSEEYQASHQESMSVNEELQSTNEELETSREELQSLNEELTTVNRQLEEKMRELERANDDLSNLLSSTAIATVFLDPSFRIRRFTPAAGELLRMISSDRGRPISDLAPHLEDPGVLDEATRVLSRLTTEEREVSDGQGRWYLRRIVPYRTSENKIEGVAITYFDVTELKTAGDQLRRRERQQAAIAQLSRAALRGEPLEELFEQAVSQVSEQLDAEMCKVLDLQEGGLGLLMRAGVGWKEGLVGTAVVPSGIDSQAGYTLQARKAVLVEDLENETRFYGPDLLIEHGVVSGISIIIGPAETPWGVLGAHSKHKKSFSIHDVSFVESVANILGEALSRTSETQDDLRGAALAP